MSLVSSSNHSNSRSSNNMGVSSTRAIIRSERSDSQSCPSTPMAATPAASNIDIWIYRMNHAACDSSSVSSLSTAFISSSFYSSCNECSCVSVSEDNDDDDDDAGTFDVTLLSDDSDSETETEEELSCCSGGGASQDSNEEDCGSVNSSLQAHMDEDVSPEVAAATAMVDEPDYLVLLGDLNLEQPHASQQRRDSDWRWESDPVLCHLGHTNDTIGGLAVKGDDALPEANSNVAAAVTNRLDDHAPVLPPRLDSSSNTRDKSKSSAVVLQQFLARQQQQPRMPLRQLSNASSKLLESISHHESSGGSGSNSKQPKKSSKDSRSSSPKHPKNLFVLRNKHNNLNKEKPKKHHHKHSRRCPNYQQHRHTRINGKESATKKTLEEPKVLSELMLDPHHRPKQQAAVGQKEPPKPSQVAPMDETGKEIPTGLRTPTTITKKVVCCVSPLTPNSPFANQRPQQQQRRRRRRIRRLGSPFSLSQSTNGSSGPSSSLTPSPTQSFNNNDNNPHCNQRHLKPPLIKVASLQNDVSASSQPAKNKVMLSPTQSQQQQHYFSERMRRFPMAVPTPTRSGGRQLPAGQRLRRVSRPCSNCS